MANRVLPSREETAWAAEYGWPKDERWQTILQAYVTGQLVDREASPEPGALLAWVLDDTIIPLEFGDEGAFSDG